MNVEPGGVGHTDALVPDPTVTRELGYRFLRLAPAQDARLVLPAPGHRVRVEVAASVEIVPVDPDGVGTSRSFRPRAQRSWVERDVYEIEIVSGARGVELFQAMSATGAAAPSSCVVLGAAPGTVLDFHHLTIHPRTGTRCSCPRAVSPAQACVDCAGSPV